MGFYFGVVFFGVCIGIKIFLVVGILIFVGGEVVVGIVGDKSVNVFFFFFDVEGCLFKLLR